MLLVDTLANAWGIDVHVDDGKTVWFELDTATATREVHSWRRAHSGMRAQTKYENLRLEEEHHHRWDHGGRLHQTRGSQHQGILNEVHG